VFQCHKDSKEVTPEAFAQILSQMSWERFFKLLFSIYVDKYFISDRTFLHANHYKGSIILPN
jgi:hypothetical protein